MKRWCLTGGEDEVVLARSGLVRMDVAVRAAFPPLRKAALAHEIRKDLWRALQGLRGFSPIVMVASEASGLLVTVGGRIDAKSWPREKTLTEIETLLSNPAKRARWIAHARLK